MSNPLFDMLGGSALPPIVQQFMQFKQSFKGDPKQQVQQMLNSGKITQDHQSETQSTMKVTASSCSW